MRLVKLTGEDGKTVAIDPSKIIAVKHFDSGDCHSIIIVNAISYTTHIRLQESADEVLRLLTEDRQPPVSPDPQDYETEEAFKAAEEEYDYRRRDLEEHLRRQHG